MRVCYIITSLDFGGAERLLVNSSNALVENHEIYIIYFKGHGKLIGSLDKRIKTFKIPLSILSFFRVRTLVKKIKPEILHTHVGHADIIGLFATIGLKIKKFSTIHNIRYTWNYVDYFYYFLYNLTFNFFAKRCKVIGVSQTVGAHISNNLGVKKQNIFILYNAIPKLGLLDKVDSRRLLKLSNEKFVVLFVGRIEAIKSVDTLIKSLSIIKNSINHLSVQVIGEGSELKKIKGLSIKLGVDHLIDFHGGLYNPEAFYSAADVFVLPSVSEAMPTVILESFRAGLPVIVSKLDSLKEIVLDSHNGLMFEVKDYKSLGGRLIQLANDSSLKMKLSANAYDSFKNKYSIDIYVNNLIKLYLMN